MHVSAGMRDTVSLQLVNRLLRLLIFPSRPTHAILRLQRTE
jgi:hypothetical protein